MAGGGGGAGGGGWGGGGGGGEGAWCNTQSIQAILEWRVQCCVPSHTTLCLLSLLQISIADAENAITIMEL